MRAFNWKEERATPRGNDSRPHPQKRTSLILIGDLRAQDGCACRPTVAADGKGLLEVSQTTFLVYDGVAKEADDIVPAPRPLSKVQYIYVIPHLRHIQEPIAQ